MKVNKMIGKAMAATIAATMLLGGATVMADEYFPVVPPLNAQEAENHTPGQTILRDESKNELERMIQEILDQAAQDATTPDEEESVPVFVLEEDTTPVQKPAEIDEPEAEFTIEILGLTEEDEETDESPFHTGDILRITNEPTTLPAGVYRIYYTERDFSTFTCASFYMHNGRMIMQRGGISISIGLEYRALRIKVLDNGTVELHPMTPAEIAMYEVPDDQVTGVPPTINTATPDNYSEPAIPAPVTVVSEEPAAPAPVTAVSEEPAAPVTQVAGAARLVAEGPGIEGFVTRLYTVALGREADPTGYAYWEEMLNSKQMTATEVADGFFNSPEFAARDLNNVEYLTVLYSVFFNREPDHNGLNHWVSYLQNGLLTREQVIEGFTNSREWINTCDIFGVEV